jgi:hypothetical protein
VHASPDLHRDHRERDRDPEAPREHVIETAVARIVVLLAVAAEALLLEEERSQPVQRAPAVERPRAGALGEVVEPTEPGRVQEVGIFDAGDRQRGPAQVDLPIGTPEKLAEFAKGLSSQGRGGSRPS